MHIKEITINHYKSIKKPMHIRDISDFQILVGTNNAGKTNILDAINLFFDQNVDAERFFDESANLEIILTHKGESHKLSYRGGESSYKEHNFKKYFVRINNSHNYHDVARKIENFKKEHPKNYQDFSIALKENFKDIEVSEELFLSNVFADNKERSVERIGSGFKRLFVILFYVFHPQYKVILIDEPATDLHPSVIRKFLNILSAKKLDKQIFLTTHHPTFVQAKYLPQTWRVFREEEGSTSLCGFSKRKVDVSRFIQEINDDNSGMLFSDKVLLVEGVSDRIFIREMVNRFYRKDKSIKVVYTSGKGSIDIYANLCETFRIPYAIMLDRDAVSSSSLQRVKKFPVFKKKVSLHNKIEELKKREIFILEKDLEHVYPQKYPRKETKPLTALFVSQNIKKEDLQDKRMKTIKEMLEQI